MELAKGGSVDNIENAVLFDGGLKKVPDALPVPEAGRDHGKNLDVVVDAGWITKAELCQDVPSGRVAICG